MVIKLKTATKVFSAGWIKTFVIFRSLRTGVFFFKVRSDRWIFSNVSIAPSTIIISEVNGNQIAQCRVRYLSFLGIGQDIK